MSYYGLLSTMDIKTPKLTHGVMTVPFYTGFRYAAFPARNSEEVTSSMFVQQILRNIQQAGTYTLFEERPVMLIYHEKCLPVMDIKVIKDIINRYFKYIIIILHKRFDYCLQTCKRSMPIIHLFQYWLGMPVLLASLWYC